MRLVALFALTCFACVVHTAPPPAAPGPAYGTAAAPGGQGCPDGTSCNWSCDEGNCAFACQPGATCNVACDGGGCS